MKWHLQPGCPFPRTFPWRRKINLFRLWEQLFPSFLPTSAALGRRAKSATSRHICQPNDKRQRTLTRQYSGHWLNECTGFQWAACLPGGPSSSSRTWIILSASFSSWQLSFAARFCHVPFISCRKWCSIFTHRLRFPGHTKHNAYEVCVCKAGYGLRYWQH